MSDIDSQSLSSIAGSIGARLSSRLGNPDSATAFAMAYGWNPGAEAAFAGAAWQAASRYHNFTVRALSMGLTMDQAQSILESEGLLTNISGRSGGADARLEHYAQYGYLTVLLGEVLTRDELVQQAFSFETVLNGDMDRTYAKHFTELKRDKQRGLTKAGIELAIQTEWPLERAMAAVMPYVEGT